MKFKYTIPYVIGALGALNGTAVGPVAGAGYTARVSSVDSIAPSDTALADSAVAPTIIDFPSAMRPVSAVSKNRDVVYVCENGARVMRQKGSRAWRNNNPGNIRYGRIAMQNGAIGECGGFAVFPDEETGMRALCDLLRTDSYKKLSISAAIKMYAPACQNNVALYLRKLKKMTGINQTTRLCDLDSAKLKVVANAIRTIEGWRPGTVVEVVAPHTAAAACYVVADALDRRGQVRDNVLRRVATKTL